jgi:hypothetical protein
MRVEFGPKDFDVDLADFRKYFSPVADAFGMNWRRAQSGAPFRTTTTAWSICFIVIRAANLPV